MNYYVAALKRYAVFRGRASKTEYWMFAWFNLILGCVASTLDLVAKIPGYHGIDLTNFLVPSLGRISGFFLPLYFLAILVPFLAVTARRLHDTGKSGWWCILGLIPLVGTIWLIVLLASDGDREENAYGPVVPENAYVYKPLQQRVTD